MIKARCPNNFRDGQHHEALHFDFKETYLTAPEHNERLPPQSCPAPPSFCDSSSQTHEPWRLSSGRVAPGSSPQRPPSTGEPSDDPQCVTHAATHCFISHRFFMEEFQSRCKRHQKRVPAGKTSTVTHGSSCHQETGECESLILSQVKEEQH